MNNFKKFVAVLLGVLMACVFATSAFAADFSNADTAAKAKAEIKAFAASYGITTIDNTVNSLTADQLQVIYNNMDALKATAASANATIKGTTDVAVATKAANDAVATMNSLLPAGVSISAPTIDTSDSSKIVVSADVTANGAKDTGSVVAEVPTTTTDNNTNTSTAVSNAAKNSAAASSRPFLPLRTPSPLLPALSSRPPAITPPLSLLLLLWLLPACSAWPSARSVHCKSSCISPVFDRQRAEPLALPVFRCLYGIGQFILVLDLPFI